MKLLMGQRYILVIILLGLSGCAHRITDWAMDNFKQADTFESHAACAAPYIQSITVYDEIRTEGMFDALWLADSVRAVYADLFGFRRGKSDEFVTTFLRRLIEENKHFISFYILSPFEFKLGDNKSPWMVFLDIDGYVAQPMEVKTVDLDPEYQAIFGKKYSRFKEVYHVKFDAKDAEEKPVLTPASATMSLIFRSLDKETSLTWHLPSLPDLMSVVIANQ